MKFHLNQTTIYIKKKHLNYNFCVFKAFQCKIMYSEPEFYGDLVYKFKKFIGRNDSVQKNHYTLQTYRL